MRSRVPVRSSILLRPTLNVGVTNGGVKVTVVPSQCIFEADIRLPIGLARARGNVLSRIDRTLQDLAEAPFGIQEADNILVNCLAYDHAFATCIASAAEQFTTRRPILLVGMGETDCKFFRYHEVPAFVYGPSLSGMGRLVKPC